MLMPRRKNPCSKDKDEDGEENGNEKKAHYYKKNVVGSKSNQFGGRSAKSAETNVSDEDEDSEEDPITNKICKQRTSGVLNKTLGDRKEEREEINEDINKKNRHNVMALQQKHTGTDSKNKEAKNAVYNGIKKRLATNELVRDNDNPIPLTRAFVGNENRIRVPQKGEERRSERATDWQSQEPIPPSRTIR
ncbi:unnamed protein product, partial [Protopolystoma xenopodis]